MDQETANKRESNASFYQPDLPFRGGILVKLLVTGLRTKSTASFTSAGRWFHLVVTVENLMKTSWT
jgi:hypothetical protein